MRKQWKKPRKTVRKNRRLRRSKVSEKQHATIIDSFDARTIECNTAYQLDFDISAFPRAQEVGSEYQEYRCVKVELEFVPLYDTYQETQGATTAISLPNMYYTLDRTCQQTAFTPAQMKEMGCKPVKFTKNLKRSFRPNNLAVLQSHTLDPHQWVEGDPAPEGLGTATNKTYAQSVEVVMGKWLSTQWDCNPAPATLVGLLPFKPTAYYGAMFNFEQARPDTAEPIIGSCIVRTHWQFKGKALPYGSTVPTRLIHV